MYLTEYRVSRNEMWCAADYDNYICHICAKGDLDSNINISVINKTSNFHEIAQNFTYSPKIAFEKYNKNLMEKLLNAINFMSGTCKESNLE